MSDYHEPTEELTEGDRDIHRALTSLKEEIEAVDWYHQRAALSRDESLRSVLVHNRDEEIEHATMTLEWLRRNMEPWNRRLSQYLFSRSPITEIEAESELPSSGSLAIGSLRDSAAGVGDDEEVLA